MISIPRNARKQSETRIYHAILRGINQQIIFNYDEDFDKLLGVIKDCKEVSEFELYAYCFMNNHIHLLLKKQLKSYLQGNKGTVLLFSLKNTDDILRWFQCQGMQESKAKLEYIMQC